MVIVCDTGGIAPEPCTDQLVYKELNRRYNVDKCDGDPDSGFHCPYFDLHHFRLRINLLKLLEDQLPALKKMWRMGLYNSTSPHYHGLDDLVEQLEERKTLLESQKNKEKQIAKIDEKLDRVRKIRERFKVIKENYSVKRL